MCLAVPGRILAIEGEDPLHRVARVDFSGVRREVSLGLLPDAAVDEWVLVHVGFAISRLDEKEALRTLAYLDELEEEVEVEVDDAVEGTDAEDRPR